jgi:hypothetical protein
LGDGVGGSGKVDLEVCVVGGQESGGNAPKARDLCGGEGVGGLPVRGDLVEEELGLYIKIRSFK